MTYLTLRFLARQIPKITFLGVIALCPVQQTLASDQQSLSDTKSFTLPSLNNTTDKNRLSQQLQFYTNRIILRGCNVLTKQEIEKITAPYIGRMATTNELHALRQAITQRYIEKGYITSSAIIPDQDVGNGDLIIAVIEGSLEDISISGVKQLSPDYVLREFSVSKKQPVSLPYLQQQLVSLKLNPMINQLSAELIPGNSVGKSVLNLQVNEQNPYSMEIESNNARSPSIGSEQVILAAGIHSISGWGDRTTISLSRTEGLQKHSANIAVPLSNNTEILAVYQKGESEVVEEPFNEIDVESEFYDALLGVQYYFINDPMQSITLGLTLQKRQSKTFLFGQPFSFSAGVNNGVSNTSVLKFSTRWVKYKDRQAIMLSSTLSQGLNIAEATINESAPDGRFTRWLGQIQYARQFENPLDELFFRWDIKVSNNALLPMEKFSVGGMQSVRGYRENTLIADQGMATSLEYRFGVFEDYIDSGTFQASLFFDYGLADNKSDNRLPKRHLSSVGAGILWHQGDAFQATLYAAKAFNSIENDTHTLQDSGIHFELNYQFF